MSVSRETCIDRALAMIALHKRLDDIFNGMTFEGYEDE